MTAFATPAELASYLQQDVDTSTATLALDIATATVRGIVGSVGLTTGVVVVHVTDPCFTDLPMPVPAVRTVTAVTIDGVAVTDFTVTPGALHRPGGWAVGQDYYRQPVKVTVACTYGYTAIPDDVKGATLFLAAQFFTNPTGAESLKIDDYAAGGLSLDLPPALATSLRAAHGGGAYVTGVR